MYRSPALKDRRDNGGFLLQGSKGLDASPLRCGFVDKKIESHEENRYGLTLTKVKYKRNLTYLNVK